MIPNKIKTKLVNQKMVHINCTLTANALALAFF